MKTELTDAQWLHDAEVSIEELAELSGLSTDLLRELVEYGALIPADTHSAHWSFTADCVVTVRAVSRLREDFDLDANALSVALNLIERIHGLEAQLRELRSQLPALRVKR
ncbi:MAG TPA: chaperone modulator CbpM, partial [Burkholderiales bacterium]|jgi:chaperone modulatory protein CbpM